MADNDPAVDDKKPEPSLDNEDPEDNVADIDSQDRADVWPCIYNTEELSGAKMCK